MKLTAKGEYALKVVLFLANDGQEGLVKLGTIAEKEGMSIAFLHQIVKNLKKDGILQSTRGPNGGYALGRSASKITVLQVLASVGEQIKSFEMSSKASSPAGKTVLGLFQRIDESVLKNLDKTVRSVLNSTKDGKSGP